MTSRLPPIVTSDISFSCVQELELDGLTHVKQGCICTSDATLYIGQMEGRLIQIPAPAGELGEYRALEGFSTIISICPREDTPGVFVVNACSTVFVVDASLQVVAQRDDVVTNAVAMASWNHHLFVVCRTGALAILNDKLETVRMVQLRENPMSISSNMRDVCILFLGGSTFTLKHLEDSGSYVDNHPYISRNLVGEAQVAQVVADGVDVHALAWKCGTIQFVEASTGKELWRWTQDVSFISIHPYKLRSSTLENTCVVISCWNGRTYFIDVAKRTVLKFEVSSSVSAVHVTPDSERLVFVDHRGKVRIFSIALSSIACELFYPSVESLVDGDTVEEKIERARSIFKASQEAATLALTNTQVVSPALRLKNSVSSDGGAVSLADHGADLP